MKLVKVLFCRILFCLVTFPKGDSYKGGMEEIIRFKDFKVHMTTGRSVDFIVYPVTDWTKVTTGEKGTSYLDKEEGMNEMHDEVNDQCLEKLRGSVCWRGVWDTRLYFPDEEYWGDELGELSELYAQHILPWCKEFIKSKNSSIAQFEV